MRAGILRKWRWHWQIGETMNLSSFNKLFFIGIGGMGMRALAEILIQKGMKICGSDRTDSEYLHVLREQGADIYIGHDASHITGADGIVISTAISEDNPELAEAKRLGIPIFHRSDVLAAVFLWGKGIAVAGAHGKSTTSGMLGRIFKDAGTDPTIVLGAAADYLHGNSCLGHGEYVIAEADESDGSFLKFKNYLAVVTNIENDHLDHYGTVENIKNAFVEFLDHVDPDGGAAIVCTDSKGVRDVLPRVSCPVITYGMNEDAVYRAVNKRYEKQLMLFDVAHAGRILGTITLRIPGVHNVCDAMAAVVTALYCGISFETIAASLVEFKGVARRFETKGYIDDVWVIDDYAHHPTEIKATLRAAKEIGGHRVICAFQPHRYSRTKLLLDEFSLAFDDADGLYFTDIYSAGEEPIPGIDGTVLPKAVGAHLPNREIRYVADREELAKAIWKEAKAGDMIFTMGAGTITKTGGELLRLLEEEGLADD